MEKGGNWVKKQEFGSSIFLGNALGCLCYGHLCHKNLLLNKRTDLRTLRRTIRQKYNEKIIFTYLAYG